MLTLYLIAFAIGGTLILVSLFFGGHDADVDVDGDIDMDADADTDFDAGHGIDFSGADFWIPFSSIRFGIFFAAFCGLSPCQSSVEVPRSQRAPKPQATFFFVAAG